MILFDSYLVPRIFQQRRCCPACFRLIPHRWSSVLQIYHQSCRPTNTMQSRGAATCPAYLVVHEVHGMGPAHTRFVPVFGPIPPRLSFCTNPFGCMILCMLIWFFVAVIWHRFSFCYIVFCALVYSRSFFVFCTSYSSCCIFTFNCTKFHRMLKPQ